MHQNDEITGVNSDNESMSTGIPSRGGTVTLHWDPMQKGRTDGGSFSDNASEEAGRGRLENLRRLLGYLKIMIKLPLIMRANGVNMIKWWVDAFYAAHDTAYKQQSICGTGGQ